MKPIRLLPALLFCASLLLAACSVLDAGKPPTLEPGARWAVLPFANHTETPLAGARAEAIAAALLRGRVADVAQQPATQQETLFEPADAKAEEAALDWARKAGARYALAGSVDEWRYKVGVDGEPAVGLTLRIVDVGSGQTLWSGVGSRSGWSREALAAVAQKQMRDLLERAFR